MSFEDMKQPELKRVAEEFGVEIPKGGFVKNADIVAALEADGVTFDQWQKLIGELEEIKEELVVKEPVVVRDVSNSILLKMTRANGTFEERGYKFTREHPFIAVQEDDAEYFINSYEGFRVALPSEVKEYYS